MENQTPVTLLKHEIALAYVLSCVVAVLVAVGSLAGLFFPSTLYPTEELRQSFVANDVVNLFIGLPLLIWAMALARRSKLAGLLFWLGALLYIVYNAIAYAVAMPFTWQFVVYLAQVALSAYAIVRLVADIDRVAVQQRLAGAVPEKFAGGVLAGLGVLFFLRTISQIVGALAGQQTIARTEIAVLVADLVFTPVWVFVGIWLWRKRALGYVSGAGLLFQASMLFVGLLVFFLLQPWLAGVPFPAVDFVVILVMGLICFIPLGLFVRGVLAKD
jgi:hypothetical protein